jgi:poly-gamma-glutamate capsule biosynthesis protein CapA/YwtB (metallophosphatase superfamily)
VRIAAVGDLTFGSDASRPSDGGVSLLAGARSLLDGDVVLGNLETTLADRGSAKCGATSTSCYAFRAPTSFTRSLKTAGFTILNLANNHADDYGSDGRATTAAALRAAGLRTTGRPGEIAVVRIGDARVAILGFATYPWSQDARDLTGAAALVRRADALADIVVVTGHLGAEGKEHEHLRAERELYLGEDRGDPVAFSHAVVQAGADLVALHGPHVLRALEWYRGRLIAYSLGNFSAYGNLNIAGPGGISAVLQATLRADGTWVEGRLAPIRLVGKGAPVADPNGAAIPRVRSLSRSDVGRRAPRLTASGSIVAPRT